jgi:hypothetical protein
MVDVVQVLAAAWKKCPAEEKKTYTDAADIRKIAHRAELAAWKAAGGKDKPRANKKRASKRSKVVQQDDDETTSEQDQDAEEEAPAPRKKAKKASAATSASKPAKKAKKAKKASSDEEE